MYKITIGKTWFYVACSSFRRLGQVYEEERIEQLTIPVVVFSEAELKAKLEEQLEETRQWSLKKVKNLVVSDKSLIFVL